jgi:2-oxoglutarate ferredoxin oxidoreductase subunit beta
MGALHRLMWAQEKQEFITGLIYYDGHRESLAEASDLTKMPLAHLQGDKIRPSAESLEEIMASLM